MKRIAIVALFSLLLLAASSSAARDNGYSISPVPAAPVYGQTIGWDIVGDDGAGYVSVFCYQSGQLKLAMEWGWWFPFYGYYAPLTLKVQEPWVDDGAALSCHVEYRDVVGSRNRPGANCSTYPPVPACLRLKLVAVNDFLVSR